MQHSRLYFLIQQHLDGQLSNSDKEEFNVLLDTLPSEVILAAFDQLTGDLQMDAVRDERLLPLLQNVLAVDEYLPDQKSNIIKPASRIHFLKTTWFRYAAAVLIICGIGAYLWTTNKKNEQPLANNNKQGQTDILPGGDKAVLILGDGTKIMLDSAANGDLAKQGNANIIKLANGEIAYNVTGPASADASAGVVNTMSTPKGGQYQLTLPDGSKVWLNAESSITYPAVFTGNERKVMISGEAYFDVTKNKEKPFIVKTRTDEIRVLGTQFNIRSYADEDNVKTTLVEGSVKIVARSSEVVLKPGEMSEAGHVSKANVSEVIAWKNGNFYFDNKDIKSILAEFARWYDVEVIYQGTLKNRTFFGIVKRDKPLSHVLQLLQNNNIQFHIEEGRRLVVQSN